MSHVTLLNEACPQMNTSWHIHEWVLPRFQTALLASNVIQINESLHTNEWVTPRKWMSHGVQTNESWHTCKCVTSHFHATPQHHSSWVTPYTCIYIYMYEWNTLHRRMSHGTYMNGSCHTSNRSAVATAAPLHVNESRHTYEWVMSHMWMSHVTHMNESCHTYERGMSHIWMRHLTHMN